METKFHQLALEEASKSKCAKRKVGAIIVDNQGKIIGSGHNYNPTLKPCEELDGTTSNFVVHAEISAIESINPTLTILWPLTMYVTHQPCENCQSAILKANIEKVVIVEAFMKFDTSKLRYDLIPVSAMAGMARVLTYGAKKYKPGNWKQVDNIDRYVAALYRHLEAWRGGETNDSESGLPHLEHALTNVAFLLDLDKPVKKRRR